MKTKINTFLCNVLLIGIVSAMSCPSFVHSEEFAPEEFTDAIAMLTNSDLHNSILRVNEDSSYLADASSGNFRNVTISGLMFLGDVDDIEYIDTLSAKRMDERGDPQTVREEMNAFYHGKSDDAIVVGSNLNVPNMGEFKERLIDFIGMSVSMENLQDIKKEVLVHLREVGYPLVSVSVPAGQDITTGRIFLVIIKAKLGKVIVENAEHFDEEDIIKQIRTKSGEYIEGSMMYEDLTWLNDNPYRTVELIYEPGESVGETDVRLHVYDRRPYRVFAGYENSDYNIAGDNRYFAGFDIGNMWGWDHRVFCQGTMAPRENKWWGITGSYEVPLPWKHSFKFIGSFARAKPNMSIMSLNLKGKSWDTRWIYMIPLKSYRRLRHDFSVGYEFKRSNNFLTFGGWEIFNNYIDVCQFFGAYDGSVDDKRGSTSFGLTVYYSPGDISHYNDNEKYNAQRTGAHASYCYGVVYVNRTAKLPKDFIWTLVFQGQWTENKLIMSEQLSLAGKASVRGYRESEVTADNGLVLRNEVYTPAFEVLGRNRDLTDSMQLLVFFDIARGGRTHPTVYAPSSTKTLYSVGPGLRYQLSNYLTAQLDYGFQLANVDSDSNRSHHGYATVTMSY